MTNYLSDARLTKASDENVLQYWKQRQNTFPALAMLAKERLAEPASTGSIERRFSTAGDLCRARRASMKVSTINTLILYREYVETNGK